MRKRLPSKANLVNHAISALYKPKYQAVNVNEIVVKIGVAGEHHKYLDKHVQNKVLQAIERL